MLTHLSGPTTIFPRNISTAASGGAQITVYNREKLIAECRRADYINCRINTFPVYTEYKGINRQSPDFIFIDQDKSQFPNADACEQALNTTLCNIRRELGGAVPTVLWTDNGHHIYQPLDNKTILENETGYERFQDPSIKFLRFSEKVLSGGKSDPSHNPSFKSCMIRIPGSFNSKCISDGTDPQVRIIQRWDGHRLKIPIHL